MAEKVLAIIPARGGSKGIPRKNLIELCGKPLIVWTIEAALKAECVDRVVVSSDDDEILALASNLGVVAMRRADALATDEATTDAVIEDVLLNFTEGIGDYTSFVLLQPTSPLRISTHIDRAYVSLCDSGADALISVVKSDSSILKSFFVQDGVMKGVVNNTFPFTRRQDLPDVFRANGAIYFIRTDAYLEQRSLMPEITIPFLMSPEASVDIDVMCDLDKAAAQILAAL